MEQLQRGLPHHFHLCPIATGATQQVAQNRGGMTHAARGLAPGLWTIRKPEGQFNSQTNSPKLQIIELKISHSITFTIYLTTEIKHTTVTILENTQNAERTSDSPQSSHQETATFNFLS